MKNDESLRKLRVGVNRYTGVNWSTTTRSTVQWCSVPSCCILEKVSSNQKNTKRDISENYASLLNISGSVNIIQ